MLSTCLFLTLLIGVGSYADQQSRLPKYARLIILHTNDVHGHMLPFEYGEDSNVGGVARRATMIDSLRSQCADALLVLDAGDVFTRGPLAAAYHGEPDFNVLNAIPYDVLTLGNNEFEGGDGMAGQKVLFDRIRQARIPIVCANCTYKATGKPIVPPYVILERNGIRIGIFGLTAPRVAKYSTVEGLQIEDPIQAAKRVVPILKQESDVVIGLTHIGYGLDKQLAAQVPDIDIIVGGDSHTWLYQPELVRASDTQQAFWVGGPVIAQDGEWGRCLGNLNVVLRLQGEHDYQVMSFSGELVPVNDSIKPSVEIATLLGRYTRPFETVVGESGQTVPKSEMNGWMAEVFRSVGGTQIGVAYVGIAENAIRKGPVTRLDLMKIPVFNNSLVTGQVTGEGLRVLMSDPGVIVRGVPQSVDSNASYTVCTQDFMAANVQALKGIAFKPLGKTILDALNEYLARKDTTSVN